MGNSVFDCIFPVAEEHMCMTLPMHGLMYQAKLKDALPVLMLVISRTRVSNPNMYPAGMDFTE